MVIGVVICLFLFFKQKTAYDVRISDWSSDVCSSDLCLLWRGRGVDPFRKDRKRQRRARLSRGGAALAGPIDAHLAPAGMRNHIRLQPLHRPRGGGIPACVRNLPPGPGAKRTGDDQHRSEEHTSELQSLMRISYAVFCLKKQ